MMFLTPKIASKGRDRFYRPAGPRGMFFQFDFETRREPANESLEVIFAPELLESGPEYAAEMVRGAELGCASARSAGSRICCVSLHILQTAIHDVDTSPAIVEERLADFVGARVRTWAEPLPPLHPAWLTSDVIALARGMRAAGHSGGAHALTDALLEAGCDDPLVIEHLFACTDHGPCCWVADVVCSQADGC
jgi:hypothetical protein